MGIKGLILADSLNYFRKGDSVSWEHTKMLYFDFRLKTVEIDSQYFKLKLVDIIYLQASRAQILNKATDYIQFMRRKNHSHQVSAIIVWEQNNNYY